MKVMSNFGLQAIMWILHSKINFVVLYLTLFLILFEKNKIIGYICNEVHMVKGPDRSPWSLVLTWAN